SQETAHDEAAYANQSEEPVRHTGDPHGLVVSGATGLNARQRAGLLRTAAIGALGCPATPDHQSMGYGSVLASFSCFSLAGGASTASTSRHQGRTFSARAGSIGSPTRGMSSRRGARWNSTSAG